ncbi:MAG: ADP-ribosylglycohydrolase family protein [Parcubacteria group bacterium]|nr:ADP-ribosylglycohydrolase family protein [Parcubacteria group bacterium]
MVNAGGDTDTNGSIVGSLLGALKGVSVFPKHLIDGLWQKEKILDTANRFCDTFDIKE